MPVTRRLFCTVATVAFVTGVVSAFPASFVQVAQAAETVPVSELMQPGPLPEMAMGDAKAPVTIIEYASMTCSHCADFQEKTFPELKKRYIDSGKVRYILREFPLDSHAVAAFMLARCAGQLDSGKYFTLVDTLFREQRTWAVQNPVPPLLAITSKAGFTQQSFETCLSNQQIFDGIKAVSGRAASTFKVQSTPTFFINGEKVAGALSIDEMAKVIDAHLKN